jgi:hypothetical protein
MPRIIKRERPAGDWKIERQGRAWRGDEVTARMRQVPHRAELIHGKLFLNDGDRLTLLAMLLENVGADAAVRLGDPDVWRAAVSALRSLDDEKPDTPDAPKAIE